MIHEPVPLGPRAYRSKLRSSGPIVALVPPGFLGVVSLVLLHGHTSLGRGIVGVIAARRATRIPAASWRDYWREYMWLAVGVWLGVVVALGAVNLIFGRALF